MLQERRLPFFHGVYLLCSKSSDKLHEGKCYIGYTNNPERRLGQHNRGVNFGGAKRTNNKGPWSMVLIVHGFPNQISALQFEWAWTYPKRSTRLKEMYARLRKRPKESKFQHHLRIMNEMLFVGPWNRLPLTVRWLNEKYKCQLPLPMLPLIEIEDGQPDLPRTALKVYSQPAVILQNECDLCNENFESSNHSLRIGCLNTLCSLTCHLVCLANHMLSTDTTGNNSGHYIPIEGTCPICNIHMSWVAVIQHKNKMQGIAVEEIMSNNIVESEIIELNSDDDESLDELTDELTPDNDVEVYELTD